ncbi:MAG: hypothetical protein ACRDRF_08895, partial [Pseudonocardiaceae bacterium]
MAQRNREQRAAAAARRRAHRRAHAGYGSPGPDSFGSDSSGFASFGFGRFAAGAANTGTSRAKPSAETISTALLSAAREHGAGDSEAGARIATLVAERFAEQPVLVAAAVQCAVAPLVTAAWERGWAPDDLHQAARRRLDAVAVGYLVDAIAEESQRYAKATVTQRWSDDLRQIGAVVWWEPTQTGGHLLQ